MTGERLRSALDAIERQAWIEVLDEHAGNVSRAARAMGVSRKTAQTKMVEHGLRGWTRPVEEPPPPPPMPRVLVADPFSPPVGADRLVELALPPAIAGSRWIRLRRNEGFTLVDEAIAPGIVLFEWTRNGGGYAASRGTLLHHLIIGRPSVGYVVDHINRHRLDNRHANLRIVRIAENNANRGAPAPIEIP